VEWADTHKCSECRRVYEQSDPPEEPPCGECRVDLVPDNADAARIFQKVRGQVRFYFDGKRNREYDLDHNAVWNMIDHWPRKLEDPMSVFEKVTKTFHVIKANRDDGEN
jgi:hypothetical protein